MSDAFKAIRGEIEPILTPLANLVHSLQIEEDGDEIRVRGQSTDKDITRFLMLSVVVSAESRRIFIPNIIKPEPITERGVGRSLIAAVLRAAKRLGYRLFVVGLVPEFQQKLLQWGAVQRADDVVEITDDTVLSDR